MPNDDRPAAGSPAGDAARALSADVERTSAVRRLASSAGGAGPRLDVLAAWAAELLGGGSVRIALVGDTQDRVGGSGGRPQDGARLEEWWCARTATARGPLVVADTTIADTTIADTAPDEEVTALGPVAGGGIGSCMGAPLLDAAGRAVGAVCVFAATARGWSDRDVVLLQQVAAAAVGELELAALVGEREHDRTLLDLAVAAADLGTVDLDLTTGELAVDARSRELSALDPTSEGTPADVCATLHPEDRDAATAAVQAATGSAGGTCAVEYRTVARDGTVRWIAARGATVAGPDGTPARLLGVLRDVTDPHDTATRTEQVLDAMAVGYLAMDADWVVTYVNEQAARIAATSRAELVGRVFWEAFPAARGTEFEERYRTAVATGQTVAFDAYYPRPLDVWVEVRAVPEGAGLALYFLDITARIRAQRAADEATSRRELSAAVSRELTGSLDAEQAVGRLARLVVPALGDWCLISLVDDDVNAATQIAPVVGTSPDAPSWGVPGVPAVRASGRRWGLRDVGSWHHDAASRDLVDGYARYRLRELGDAAPVWQALRENRSVVFDDATATLTSTMPPDGPGRGLLERLAPGSGVVIPLRGRGRTVGLLSLFVGLDRAPLTEEDLAIAADVADRAGLALDSARLYRQQRDLAAGLQQSLLTEPPQPDHGQIVVRYVPASEAAQVGGDWYDAFLQPDGATVLVIGDVVGHDTRAAAAMSQVRTVLRTLGATSGDSPARLLARTDEAMANLQISTTATVLVARLEQTDEDRRHGVTRVRWSSAGHPPAAVVHPDGRVELLQAPAADLLLGVVPGTARHDHHVVLDRGATVVFCTDGLVERRDQPLQEGLAALQRVLTEIAADDVDLDTLVDELLRRLLPLHAEDDAAVIAIRLHPQDRPRPAEAGPGHVPDHVPAEPS